MNNSSLNSGSDKENPYSGYFLQMHQAMKPAPTKEFKTILFVDLEYKYGQVSLQRETERKIEEN